MIKTQPIYKRVLIKLSGEALMGDSEFGIDPAVLKYLAQELRSILQIGVQIGIVIGGGNFFRGRTLTKVGLSRVTADHIGILGTLINALALRDVFEQQQIPTRVLSAVSMSGIVDQFDRRKAMHHLNENRVVILAGGTGNPLVTADSALSLRGIEIEADLLLKATNVDGIYSSDPAKNPTARLYKKLTYREALKKELNVMDLEAFCQCRDHNMQLTVFNINKPGALRRIVYGEEEGTFVTGDKK